jgi:acetyl esterase
LACRCFPGSRVRYENYSDVTHEFSGMNAVVPDAEKAQAFAAADLKQALSQRATGAVKMK